MRKEQAPIMVPYEQEEFWGQIRAIIKEELASRPERREPEAGGEPFLPRSEVAKMLKVSLVTLNTWVKKGLPAHKQHGKVYFLKSEVTAYIRGKSGGRLMVL